MATQMKLLLAFVLMAALVCVQAQDYDDEGGNSGDGYGGFSGGGGDDDYAAPRERGVIGAEGSDSNPGYHQGEDSGNENYDSDDVAAAASQAHPTISRPNLIKLIKQSR